MHETLSDNKSRDVSESECNIVHEILSQKHFTDVPANVITELKDNKHKEPSMILKEQAILTYLSAVETYWINLTLHTNGRSWNNQYKRDTINHHQHEIGTTINWKKVLSIRPSEVTEP